jgi:hypothetical protein
MPVRKVWLHTSVVMPAALARWRTIFPSVDAVEPFPREFRLPAAVGAILMAWKRSGFAQPGTLDIFGEVALQRMWQGISWNLPPFSWNRSHSRCCWWKMSPTLRPQAAESWAKVNSITPIKARSEEHADGGHVLLEGGGRQAVGLDRFEIVFQRADVLDALFAAVFEEGKE